MAPIRNSQEAEPIFDEGRSKMGAPLMPDGIRMSSS